MEAAGTHAQPPYAGGYFRACDPAGTGGRLLMQAYGTVVQRFATGVVAFAPQVLISTFIGLLLIGGLYMALGCFASSLTETQTVAAILSYVFGLALFVLSLRSLMGEPPAGWTGHFFQYI